MTDHNREEREALIEKIMDELHPQGLWNIHQEDHHPSTRAKAKRILTVFEQAYTPTSDEREALAALIDPDTSRAGWNANAHDVRDQINGLHIKRGVYRIVDRILGAGFRRPEVPEPQGEHFHIWSELPCKAGECRMEPQAEPPLPLDPQPWALVSDQVFGVRSAIDKGFHSVSGAYYVFQPRAGYEQDRARYEDKTTVHEIRRQS